MAERHTVLAVEDNDEFYDLLKAAFADRYNLFRAASVTAALSLLNERSAVIDVMLLDMWLPRDDGGRPERNLGLEVLLKTKGRPISPGMAPEVQVIVVTGHPDLQNAIETQRLGSFRYIVKGSPNMLEELGRDVEAAFTETMGRRIHRAIMESGRLDLLQPLPLRASRSGVEGVAKAVEAFAASAQPGRSEDVAGIFRQIRRLADEALTVLEAPDPASGSPGDRSPAGQ